MSKKKEKTNRKREMLNEINLIDKKLKRHKKNDGEKVISLMSRRNILRNQIKTNK